jgi:MFS family permease
MQKTLRTNYILPLIVLSQFAGTSLWFAGNAILPDIQRELQISTDAGNITSAVQFGFILGTLVFAILAIADRFAPSKVFFLSALMAATANAGVGWWARDIESLMTLRFLTGFFLAGVYPVGMKIAADWYQQGLGKALGYLLGALVLGTAFPHLLKGGNWHLPWKDIIYITSSVAVAGGLLVLLFIPPGPYRKKGTVFHPRALAHIFNSRDFRSAAGGYFGHMWELYAFWAFVPTLIQLQQQHARESYNIPLWSFAIIAVGCLGCVVGGYISRKYGSAIVAFYALLVSGICCALCWAFVQAGSWIFLPFMMIWGITVIADSPQYSALVASTAPAENKGTALTFVNCIGFAITIASIQCLNYLFHQFPYGTTFLILVIGPVAGLTALYRLVAMRRNKRQVSVQP